MHNNHFDALYEYIQNTQSNIAQITILQHEQIIYSAEWNSFKSNDCVHIMSVTKSIIALLIGIAIYRGYLESIDLPVLKFFPDYRVKRGEKTIYDVTIRHLLTMTAPYKYKSEPWTKVCTSEDWTVAALDLLGGRRGITGEFKYATLGIQILCGIIERITNMSPLQFANRYLLLPLGIEQRVPYIANTAEEHKAFIISKAPKERIWFVDPRNIPTAGFGLCLSSGELAKIGQLCLNMGSYNGNLFFLKDWIRQIRKPSSMEMDAFGGMSYGMLWWIPNVENKAYVACGTGGNVLYVHPELDAVVSVTSTFKPAVYDRINFIEEQVVPLLI